MLSKFENILWLTGFILNSALVAVLIRRQSYRSQRWFVAWIATGSLATLILFAVSRLGSEHLYFVTFWTSASVDIFLQLLVAWEIAQSVLCRQGSWVTGAKEQFERLSMAAFVVALILSITVKPAVNSLPDDIYARVNLFLTVLFCLMCGAMMTLSERRGLSWHCQAARAGFGFAFWNILSFATDTLHAYWRTLTCFDSLEYLRSITYQIVLVYWLVLYLRASRITSETQLVTAEQLARTWLSLRIDADIVQRRGLTDE